MKKILLALILLSGTIFIPHVQAACDPPECGQGSGGQTCGSGYICVDKCCNPKTCIPGSTSCGSCSQSCGGGTQSCSDGCSTWSQNCNTQACCSAGSWANQGCGLNSCATTSMYQTRTTSPNGCTTGTQCSAMYPACLANCSGMTSSAVNFYTGESTNLTANFTAPANLQEEFFWGNAPTMNTLTHQNVGGTSGTLSYTWTPAAAGTYQVGCRSFNDSIGECRPTGYTPSPAVAGIYVCSGPTTITTVTVTNPTCSAFGVSCPTSVRAGNNFTCTGSVTTTPTSGVSASKQPTIWNILGTPGVVTLVSQAETVNSPGNYTETATFNAAASGLVSINMSDGMVWGGQSCSNSSANINIVKSFSSWFGGGGGGDMIAASGDITSPVSVALPAEPQQYFTDSTSTIPPAAGLAIGQNFVGFNQTTIPQVNSLSWWNQINPQWTTILSHPETSYTYMKERILARAPAAKVINSGSIDLSDGTLSIGAPILSGVFILRVPGSVNLSGDAGALKYLILADGVVNITGKTGALSAANGFFAVLSDSDINVSSSVGSAGNSDIKLSSFAPHLRGVFYANNIFSTGGGNLQLKVDGTVVGMSGVSLGRNNAGLYPSEYFQFNPGFFSTLSQIGLRHKIIQELLDF